MIKSGLVSITFRKLKPKEIVRLVQRAGLDGIEWGGDIHVPHGNVSCARDVREMTEDAGLMVASYGSYYRLGISETEGLPFASVLDTAIELKAPVIRVWAGNRGSADAEHDYRKVITEEALRIADIALTANIKIAFEYHGGTLTDTNASALQLIHEAQHRNICLYWQPENSLTFPDRLKGLKTILPYLSNIHVFHWLAESGNNQRLPFGAGEEDWSRYFQVINDAPGDRYAMLEFVCDDSPQQFIDDSETLKRLLNASR